MDKSKSWQELLQPDASNVLPPSVVSIVNMADGCYQSKTFSAVRKMPFASPFPKLQTDSKCNAPNPVEPMPTYEKYHSNTARSVVEMTSSIHMELISKKLWPIASLASQRHFPT